MRELSLAAVGLVVALVVGLAVGPFIFLESELSGAYSCRCLQIK